MDKKPYNNKNSSGNRADKRGGNRKPQRDSKPYPKKAERKPYSSAPRPYKMKDEVTEAPEVFEEFPEDMALILGRNPVIEALKADTVIDVLFVNPEAGGSIGQIIKLAKERQIVIKEVSETKLTNMAKGAVHQGVIAMGGCAEYVEIEDILAIARERNEDPFIIICDEIEDPHNLGAIIRTAETAGAHGVIIPKRRSASLNHTVYKTSAGAASWMPVARVPNIPQALDDLKKAGVWIYGTDGSGADYSTANLTGPIGLVIGSEGFGMGRLVASKCDFMLKLPMKGKITSLNASVAAGIFMYEIVRQRGLK